MAQLRPPHGTTAEPGILDALLDPVDPRTGRAFGAPDPKDDPSTIEASDDGEARDQQAAEASNVQQAGLRDMGWRDVISVGKSTFTEIGEDRVTYVSGGVTFFAILSLFPAITAFVSIYGLMADPATIESHLAMMEGLVPPGALDIVYGQISAIASGPGGLLTIAGLVALGVAFWSANGGMKALLSALNVAFFQRETRSFVKFNLVSMGFTLAGLLLIAMMLVVIAVIPAILRAVPMAPNSEWLLNLIRWPILFAALVLALAAIYRWGPSKPSSRWHWVSPGAVIAGILLVITSVLFSWYAANFGDYNETYGSLGAIIALMTWLWLNATIVLVGAEINSELERHLKRKSGLPDPKVEALKEEIERT